MKQKSWDAAREGSAGSKQIRPSEAETEPENNATPMGMTGASQFGSKPTLSSLKLQGSRNCITVVETLDACAGVGTTAQQEGVL